MAAPPDITWDDVIVIASELADVAEGAQDIILAYVNGALSVSMFKPAALKLARIYLAAHIATVTAEDGDGAAIGPVISESVGGISRTYAAISAVTRGDGFDATSYGQTFGFLVRTSRARLPRVI
jgi:hypothetical protein